ncbi:MAG: HypC/HybG/HupF family hydrogenase formation chaperone [Nitrospirae bacterium]|nr:HypC/HybG/HupF family hydrogenase formation chaperone [Nitrospirota bacterium]
MCLAVPSRIVEINNLLATVDVYGARKEISLLLLPEDAKIGDYVLVHAGFAIQKVDENAAKDALNLLKEIAESMEQ